MRLLLILFILGTASCAVLLQNVSKTQKNNIESVSPCRPDFTFYEGFCVCHADGNEHTYQQAVDICSSLGAYAPSMHSQEDLDFWTAAIPAISVSPYHFWLDAYCPSTGQVYRWMDGTPTDYMGPKGELQNCKTGEGLHLEFALPGTDGLNREEYSSPAPALCVYDPLLQPLPTTEDPTTEMPTTVTSTTMRPTTWPATTRTTTRQSTTPSKTTTLKPSTDSDYCTCNPSTVYLDIVFVVDTSDDMTKNLVGDITATIKSTLYGLTFGTGKYQSNVAVLAYAETVQTVVNFGDFKSSKDISSFSLLFLGGNPSKMADAIKQASSIIYSNGRSFSSGVIVLLTNSYDQRHASNIDEETKAFKDDGGVFISVDYSKGLGIAGLNSVASPGFYINDTASNPSLDSDMLYAFCDANCFCKEDLMPYNVVNERGRELPNGCYRVAGFSAVYQSAKENCEEEGGFVATVHDDDKNFFMISLFPSKTRYWLGLQRIGGTFEWADGSNDGFTYWAPGNPIAGQDCVYGQQQTGFNSPWFSAPCTDPLKNSMPYACQLHPCSSEYDCFS